MIRAGLRGWRRGSDELNWRNGELEHVVWRAVILSLDYVYDPCLFKEWEDRGFESPKLCLKERGLIRENRTWEEGQPPFCITVSCSGAKSIQTPLMLEHLLTCLLTNALKASRIQDERGLKPDYFKPIDIQYDSTNSSLVISNELGGDYPGLTPVLCDVLNTSRTIEEFETRIQDLLRGPVQDWPGIGLVEAYCVAKQCFGGLVLDAMSSRVSIRLVGSKKEKR